MDKQTISIWRGTCWNDTEENTMRQNESPALLCMSAGCLYLGVQDGRAWTVVWVYVVTVLFPGHRPFVSGPLDCHAAPHPTEYQFLHSAPGSPLPTHHGHLTTLYEGYKTRSRYSDWLRAGRPRCRSSSPGRVKNFHFSMSSRPALGSTKPPIQWVRGTLSSEIKRSGREADHSPPTSAEVKNTRIYTSTPHTSLIR
jgi:hypothetical protein